MVGRAAADPALDQAKVPLAESLAARQIPP